MDIDAFVREHEGTLRGYLLHDGIRSQDLDDIVQNAWVQLVRDASLWNLPCEAILHKIAKRARSERYDQIMTQVVTLPQVTMEYEIRVSSVAVEAITLKDLLQAGDDTEEEAIAHLSAAAIRTAWESFGGRRRPNEPTARYRERIYRFGQAIAGGREIQIVAGMCTDCLGPLYNDPWQNSLPHRCRGTWAVKMREVTLHYKDAQGGQRNWSRYATCNYVGCGRRVPRGRLWCPQHSAKAYNGERAYQDRNGRVVIPKGNTKHPCAWCGAPGTRANRPYCGDCGIKAISARHLKEWHGEVIRIDQGEAAG